MHYTTYCGTQMPTPLAAWLKPEHGLCWQTEPETTHSGTDPVDEEVAGAGLLAETQRRFRIRYGHQGALLRLDGGFTAQIGAGGERVQLIDLADAGLDVLLGPPLILALALRGIHCLHASAAITPNGIGIAFTAPSGTGKSTLADTATAFGWQRLSDDLSPLDARCQLLPRFPQLKLGAHPDLLPSPVKLSHLVLLRRGARAALQPLGAAAVAKLLLAATVGAKMYSAAMREQHFHWATQTANRLAMVGAWQLTIEQSTADPRGAARSALERLLEQLR